MNPLIIAILILILVAALLVLLFFYCELRERYRGLMDFTVDALKNEYSREDVLKISGEWRATTSWLDE